MGIYITILRFFGMYAPSQSLRIAMYKKAGVKMGNLFSFGSHIFIDVDRGYDITIGDDVILAGYDYLLTHSNILWGIKDEGGPVTIKSGSRIGLGVTILPGVTIGQNAVIGACSLVNRNIPDNCIAAGVPAKPIKLHHFHKHELCRSLTPSDIIADVETIDDRKTS